MFQSLLYTTTSLSTWMSHKLLSGMSWSLLQSCQASSCGMSKSMSDQLCAIVSEQLLYTTVSTDGCASTTHLSFDLQDNLSSSLPETLLRNQNISSFILPWSVPGDMWSFLSFILLFTATTFHAAANISSSNMPLYLQCQLFTTVSKILLQDIDYTIE